MNLYSAYASQLKERSVSGDVPVVKGASSITWFQILQSVSQIAVRAEYGSACAGGRCGVLHCTANAATGWHSLCRPEGLRLTMTIQFIGDGCDWVSYAAIQMPALANRNPSTIPISPTIGPAHGAL